MKHIAEHLAELLVQARGTEERVAKAQSQTRELIQQQRERAWKETERALGKLTKRFEEARGDARTGFKALQAKVNADVDQMREHASEAKDKVAAWQKDHASQFEADALAAVDYAVAATKLAEFKILDAIAARADAISAKARAHS